MITIKTKDQEFDGPKNIVHDDTPFSWDGMEQAAECVHSQRYGGDPSRSNFSTACSENVVCKG